MRGIVSFVLSFVLAATAYAADGERLRLKARFSDSIPTNVLGTSLDAPPTVQVIRSRRGAEYFLKKHSNYNNLTSANRLYKLKRQLLSVDFQKYMVIAVLSQPMDNYDIDIKKITLSSGVINVEARYRHQLRNYRIPPKKSIYYNMAVVERRPQPVLLDSHRQKVNTGIAERKPVTVTGRLMPFNESSYQLVPVRIRRGKKDSYYIKTADANKLQEYVGKVITLAGTVSHAMDSPYEHDLQVEKLVRARD